MLQASFAGNGLQVKVNTMQLWSCNEWVCLLISNIRYKILLTIVSQNVYTIMALAPFAGWTASQSQYYATVVMDLVGLFKRLFLTSPPIASMIVFKCV